MTAVAAGALLVSELVVVAGKAPLEPALLAISIGMLLRARGGVTPACEPGLQTSEPLLTAGLALLGAELAGEAASLAEAPRHLARLLEHGVAILGVVVVTMVAGIAAICALGRVFRLPRPLVLMLSVGTTICGGTAIAIVAPILRAPEADTSRALGTISLWGLAAILIYPLAAHWLGVSDVAFGVFAGSAIHSTPQVLGAGYIYSELAGDTAAAVKLVRSCFIAPVALALALSEAPRQLLEAGRPPPLWRIFPWFLFGFFVLAALRSLGLLHGAVAAWMGAAGKHLMLVGMAGVGLNTHPSAFFARGGSEGRSWHMGARPLLVGLLGSIVVALVSGSMIRLVMEL